MKIMSAKSLRFFSRIILLIIAIFWFVFALLSGSSEYGGGLRGIMLNSPNALPWLLLLVFIYISFCWQVLGGVLISLMGFFTIIAFNSLRHMFVFWLISLPLIILGSLLTLSHFLIKNKKIKEERK